MEEDRDGKLICEQIVGFDEAAAADGQPLFQRRRWNHSGYTNGMGGGRTESRQQNSAPGPGQSHTAGNVDAAAVMQQGKVPRGIWLQFPDADSYFAREQELFSAIADSDGNDDVVIYLKNTRGIKVLPPNRRVSADEGLQDRLGALFGTENVKIR